MYHHNIDVQSVHSIHVYKRYRRAMHAYCILCIHYSTDVCLLGVKEYLAEYLFFWGEEISGYITVDSPKGHICVNRIKCTRTVPRDNFKFTCIH